MTDTTANPVDLLDTVRQRRIELTEARRLRTRGEAGYSDLTRCEYLLQLALLDAEAAGLLVPSVHR